MLSCLLYIYIHRVREGSEGRECSNIIFREISRIILSDGPDNDGGCCAGERGGRG